MILDTNGLSALAGGGTSAGIGFAQATQVAIPVVLRRIPLWVFTVSQPPSYEQWVTD